MIHLQIPRFSDYLIDNPTSQIFSPYFIMVLIKLTTFILSLKSIFILLANY